MSMTLTELQQQLKDHVDEVTLLEVLGISAEDIVERFVDKIEENFDKLTRDFDDNNTSDS